VRADVTDEIVCARAPEYFAAVGEWYHDFSQTTDETFALFCIARLRLPGNRADSRDSRASVKGSPAEEKNGIEKV
jgi:hypothetical protein